MTRKLKAEWENDFPPARWIAMDEIESAYCKLY